MKSIRSLNTPMIDARNAIKEQLAVTPENSWLNPRSGEREHLARKYLNFSEAEWAAMHALTEQGRELRLEGQQLLNDPAAIVARGAELLCSGRWEDIAVGLAVTTGRRLTEILKTAVFHPMSAYTVEFEGQLKQKAELLAPYEIPTLCEADLVIEAAGRLRTLLSCRDLEKTEVERRYGPTVRATTHRHFQHLIRIRANDVSVYTHACRAVYGRIATYYFAPPTVNALVYLATIQGHYWLLRSESEEQRRNY